MKFRASKLQITNENPFIEDCLNRKPFVESISNILKSGIDPLVISLNAPWGFGKSTFLEMLKVHLKNQSLKVIHFNAWESDYVEDPFAALLGDMQTQLEELRSNDSGIVRNATSKVVKFGKAILKASGPALIKAASAGIINCNEITEQVIASAAEKYAEERIESYQESKKSVEFFKAELGNLAASLYSENEDFPLVFIIDELDRCRPNHAVRLLETVKHFFSIERVVFVIAMDQTQLAHSIKTLYGQDMNVEGYLRRFFDINVELPTPKIKEFVKMQFKRFDLDQFFDARLKYPQAQYDKDSMENFFEHIFENLQFSLREIERSFATLSLIIRSIPEKDRIDTLIIGVLVVLKIKNHELAKKLVDRSASGEELLEFFCSNSSTRCFSRNQYDYLTEGRILRSFSNQSQRQSLIAKYKSDLAEKSVSKEEKQRIETIIDVLEELRYDGSSNLIVQYYAAMELLS